MGKSHNSGESGIGGSLRSSLSKFTERVTLKAPSAEAAKSAPAAKSKAHPPQTSQPKAMTPPVERGIASPTKRSSGTTKASQPAPKPEPKAPAKAPAKAAAASTPVKSVAAAPKQSASTSGSANKLANDVNIVGRLRFSDRLVFDGRIKGEIESDGALAVQSEAIVEATVSVKTLLVEGKIIGNIIATESVRLGPTAVVVGDITTDSLTVEPEASFSGQAKIGSPTAAVKQSPSPAQKSPSPATAQEAPKPAPQSASTSKAQITGKMPAPPAGNAK